MTLSEKLAAVKRYRAGYVEQKGIVTVVMVADEFGQYVALANHESLLRAFNEAVRQRDEWAKHCDWGSSQTDSDNKKLLAAYESKERP